MVSLIGWPMYLPASFLVLIVILFSILFCEYLIYYLVLYQCSWPSLPDDIGTENTAHSSKSNELKVALIADTHLLGIRKGHWFDKIRREWQMYRSFRTLIQLYDPEIVFILGDIFDEASFSPDDIYSTYVKTFKELFHVDKSRKLYVIAGNHDIGFHYAMHPYLENRFKKTMNVTSIITKKNNHFVLINSMALEKDGCNICRRTEREIQRLSDKFRCSNGTMECSKNKKFEFYSRPIVLMHFPLYRENDSHCSGWSAAPNHEKEARFKEKWDCLSKDATDYVLNQLHPRVVFTGHTHHSCKTLHEPDIPEYTIPSFNWRNKPNPSFILAVFTPHQYVLETCALPSEYAVIFMYILAVILSIIILYRNQRTKRIMLSNARKKV